MEKPGIPVIVPAGKLFDRTFEAIAITKKDFGPQYEFVRVSTNLSDPQLSTSLIQIERSPLIIADVTARNPNVMFLVGYARALKRTITYITQTLEEYPFDESTHPIVYGKDFTYLSDQFVFHHCGCDSITNQIAKTDARAKFLSIFGDLLQKHRHEHHGPVIQEEPNVFTLLDQDMDLPLVQDIARRGRELGIRVRLM